MSIFLLLTGLCSFPQGKDDINLLQQLTFKPPYPNYTYMLESVNLDIPYFTDRLKRGRYYERNPLGTDSVLRLTLGKDEVKYVLQQVALNKNYVFPKGMLPPSISVAKDTIVQYVKNQSQEYDRELREVFEKEGPEAGGKFRDTHPQRYMAGSKCWINYFSKPVYLRNGTLAFIYTGYFCGDDCGCSDAAFYRKTKDGWSKLVSIRSGCN